MRLRDALRLKAGDLIAWGHSHLTRKIEEAGTRQVGFVLCVTRRGGIRVKPRNSRRLQWVPYHHVINKIADAERASRMSDEDLRFA